MTEKGKSLFDEIPEEGKKRKKILVNLILVGILTIIIAVMLFREGKNIFEMPCKDCISKEQCDSSCMFACMRNGYDSATSAGYNSNLKNTDQIMCDCRCDHTLHTAAFEKKCAQNYTNFGDYCCTDLDEDKVCDKYYLAYSKVKADGENLLEKKLNSCTNNCDDKNVCTLDSCEKTDNTNDYACMHRAIIPCCGNMICEEGEKCGTCFVDCGGCLSIEALKKSVEETYGIYGKEKWLNTQDLKNKKTIFSFDNGNVQIIRVDDAKEVMNDYSKFKSQNFKLESNKNIAGIVAFNPYPDEFIIYEKDQSTLHGKIEEKIGFWKKAGETDGEMFHHFNVYCSQDLYVRIIPEWEVRSNNDANWQGDKIDSYKYVYSEKYNEMLSKNQFDIDRKILLPLAEKILESCPLSNSILCEDCKSSIRTKQIIDKISKKYIVFLETEKGRYYDLEDSEKVIIQNSTSKNSFGSFSITGYFDMEDNKYMRSKLDEMDLIVGKNPERIQGSDKYFKYASHNVSKEELYNYFNTQSLIENENVSKNEDEIYERNVLTIYRYDIRQEIRAIDDSPMGFMQSKKDLVISISRSTFMCNRSVVSLSFHEGKVLDYRLNDNQIALLVNEVKSKQITLTNQAKEILKSCVEIVNSSN